MVLRGLELRSGGDLCARVGVNAITVREVLMERSHTFYSGLQSLR